MSIVGRLSLLVASLIVRRRWRLRPPEPAPPAPSLEEWIALSDEQRRQILGRWNPYGGEGFELVSRISEDYREQFGHLRGVEVTGPGVYHGGDWVIGVRTPFIIDRRPLPHSHLGIGVRYSGFDDLPREFQDGTRTNAYVWAPEHYEQFVDRAADDIRRELGQPAMTRDELLSALVGMPFHEYVARTRR